MAISTTAAIIGASVIGAGASVVAGNKAAKATKNAAQTADATNRYIFDQQREDFRPYREVGYGALGKLASLYGIPGAEPSTEEFGGFKAAPGYQFRLSEGLKAIERSAAAGGKYRGGATAKALTRYAEDYATSEYENYANRLASLAGIGQSATNSTAQAGQVYANQQSQTNLAAGNARASAYTNVGNAINNGVGSVTAAYLYNQGYGGFGGFGGGSSSTSSTVRTPGFGGGGR